MIKVVFPMYSTILCISFSTIINIVTGQMCSSYYFPLGVMVPSFRNHGPFGKMWKFSQHTKINNPYYTKRKKKKPWFRNSNFKLKKNLWIWGSMGEGRKRIRKVEQNLEEVKSRTDMGQGRFIFYLSFVF